MKSKFVVATFDRTPCTEKEMQDNTIKVRDLYNEGYRHLHSFTMGQLDYGVFELVEAELPTISSFPIVDPSTTGVAPQTEPPCAFDGTHVSHEAVANPVNEDLIAEQVLAIAKSIFASAWAHRSTIFTPDTFYGQKMRDKVNGFWRCFTDAEWSAIYSIDQVIMHVVAYCKGLQQKPQRETADTTAPR